MVPVHSNMLLAQFYNKLQILDELVNPVVQMNYRKWFDVDLVDHNDGSTVPMLTLDHLLKNK